MRRTTVAVALSICAHLARGAEDTLPLLRYGPIDFRPHAAYSYQRDEGTLLRPGLPENTTVQEIRTGIRVNAGNHWVGQYENVWSMYSNPLYRDTVDHSIAGSGGYQFGTVNAQVSASVATHSRPSIETARQTDSLATSLAVAVNAMLTQRLSWRSTLSQGSQFVDAAPDSITWQGFTGLQHNSDRLTASGGVTAGYTAIYKTPDTQFVGPAGSLTYRLGERFDFTTEASLDFRSSLGNERVDSVEPTYGASLAYRPLEHTTLTVSGNREFSPSLLSRQERQSTLWSATVRQRLLGRLQLGITYSFGTTEYAPFARFDRPSRTDDLERFRFTLGLPFLQRGMISANYEETSNESSTSGFDFDSRRMGFEISYRY